MNVKLQFQRFLRHSIFIEIVYLIIVIGIVLYPFESFNIDEKRLVYWHTKREMKRNEIIFVINTRHIKKMSKILHDLDKKHEYIFD